MYSKRGFTLIELLIVITIIAVLSLIGLVSYNVVLKNGRDAKRQSDLRQIQAALEQYYSDQLYYPCSITFGAVLTSSVGNCDATAPNPIKTYMSTTPSEAVSGRTQYGYAAYASSAGGICRNTTTKCRFYCIWADMEGGGYSVPTNCSNPTYDFGVKTP